MKNKCKHKFEPRYTEHPNSAMNYITAERTTAKEYRKLLYYQEYVKDICVNCGKEIKR